MYCPSCGARLAQALTYCNKCGANLSTLKVDRETGKTETTSDTLLWVIVGTTISLLGMSLGALVLMKNGAIHQGLGIAFVILSFVALVLVDGVLLWRLLHLNKAAATWPPARLKDLSTEELEPASARTPNELARPAPSISEQTTRSFEPSFRKGE
jgi:hypothetical protein